MIYILGEQVNEAIQDLIEDLETGDPFDSTLFSTAVHNLIRSLDACKSLSHWSRLIRLQHRELSRFLENSVFTVKNIEKEDKADSGPSASFNTPNSSGARTEITRTVKKFSPLVDNYSKIQCSSVSCTSTFSHKRTYLKHMHRYHPYLEVDNSVRDPKGTCELISPRTGFICGAKLPFRSMYVHLETVHSVKKPSADHILVGFDLTSTPKPIFALKGEGIDYLDNMDSGSKDIEKSKLPMSNSNLVEAAQISQEEINLKKTEEDSDEPVVSQAKPWKRIMVESSSDSSSFTGSSKKNVEFKALDDYESLLECDTQPINTKSDYFQDNSYYSDMDEYLQAETQREQKDDESDTSKSSTSSSSSSLSKHDEKVVIPIRNNRGAKRKCFSSPNSSDSNHTPKKERTGNSVSHCSNDNNETPTVHMSDNSQSQSSFKDINEEEDDSDYLSGDSEDYTTCRRENKAKRYASRKPAGIPLYEQEVNVKFIQDYSSFMRKNNTTGSKDTDNPTIAKYVRHLFTIEDSFLSYETKENPNFTLESLRLFQSPSYIHLKYPLDWILSTSGNDGNRGTDRLKSHSSLRQFLEYEVDRFSQSNDFSDVKKAVRENLEGISKQISSNKLFRRFSIQTNIKKHKKDRAKLILEPSKQLKIEKLVTTWHNSLECDEFQKDMDFIYQNAMKSKNISSKNFTKYCNYARVYLLLRLD